MSPAPKTTILSLIALSTLTSAFASPTCDGIQKSIADNQNVRAKMLACVQDADATILKMKTVAANSYDRTVMSDPNVQAAFKMVYDRRNQCVDVYNGAGTTIKNLKAEYAANCEALAKLSALSDSSLVAKAAAKEVGKCMLEETSKTTCPMKILVNGRGFPIGDGCQKTITEAASVLRDALKDGQCF